MPCSPSVTRTYLASHFFSNISPARLRSASSAGASSGSRQGTPAAWKASARFGFTTVTPRQSTECRRWVNKLLAIDTNNLLLTRDDAGLDSGAKRLLLDGIGDVDFSLGQYFAELLATAVFSQQANYRDVINELAQIARDIGGASRIK